MTLGTILNQPESARVCWLNHKGVHELDLLNGRSDYIIPVKFIHIDRLTVDCRTSIRETP